MTPTPEERAKIAFGMALGAANMLPQSHQEWFRDAERHILRQTAEQIRSAEEDARREERAAIKKRVCEVYDDAFLATFECKRIFDIIDERGETKGGQP